VTTGAKAVFLVDVFALLLLLSGTLWSIALPGRRIWPPPRRRSWQYLLTWALFYLAFACNALLLILDWNSWLVRGAERFLLGVPLMVVGAGLVTWGVRTLGTMNTSGVSDKFIRTGPYEFSRNPQYLGDMALFIGLSMVANSLALWITHGLLILVFLITPLAEEPWLMGRYGQEYDAYRRSTPRFL
jgi:protein-S-isoprenylcysteine O-methyltransferase Ste14